MLHRKCRDSRAIVVTEDPETGGIIAKALSIDHKLIFKLKQIEYYQVEEIGTSSRSSWRGSSPSGLLADIDVPGLAMSRSLVMMLHILLELVLSLRFWSMILIERMICFDVCIGWNMGIFTE